MEALLFLLNPAIGSVRWINLNVSVLYSYKRGIFSLA